MLTWPNNSYFGSWLSSQGLLNLYVEICVYTYLDLDVMFIYVVMEIKDL